jgi:hypothetical protein
MQLIASLLLIASVIAAIMVLVKLFQVKGALHGIMGFFCGLYPFIWGWMNSKTLNLMKLMLIWTVGGVLGYAFMIPSILDEVEKAQAQLEQAGTPSSQPAAEPAPAPAPAPQ